MEKLPTQPQPPPPKQVQPPPASRQVQPPPAPRQVQPPPLPPQQFTGAYAPVPQYVPAPQLPIPYPPQYFGQFYPSQGYQTPTPQGPQYFYGNQQPPPLQYGFQQPPMPPLVPPYSNPQHGHLVQPPPLQPPPPPPQLQQPVITALRIADLEAAILTALVTDQPGKHLANNETDAECKKYDGSKMRGIHSALDSQYSAQVAGEIFRKITRSGGSLQKLSVMAAKREGQYERSQAFEMRFDGHYYGWEAQANGPVWGKMYQVDIRGCQVDRLKIWIQDGQWVVKFHFIPRRDAKV